MYTDRPEQPVAAEGRPTNKNRHIMKGNQQTKQHRGGERHNILKPCTFYTSYKKTILQKVMHCADKFEKAKSYNKPETDITIYQSKKLRFRKCK